MRKSLREMNLWELIVYPFTMAKWPSWETVKGCKEARQEVNWLKVLEIGRAWKLLGKETLQKKQARQLYYLLCQEPLMNISDWRFGYGTTRIDFSLKEALRLNPKLVVKV